MAIFADSPKPEAHVEPLDDNVEPSMGLLFSPDGLATPVQADAVVCENAASPFVAAGGLATPVPMDADVCGDASPLHVGAEGLAKPQPVDAVAREEAPPLHVAAAGSAMSACGHASPPRAPAAGSVPSQPMDAVAREPSAEPEDDGASSIGMASARASVGSRIVHGDTITNWHGFRFTWRSPGVHKIKGAKFVSFCSAGSNRRCRKSNLGCCCAQARAHKDSRSA